MLGIAEDTKGLEEKWNKLPRYCDSTSRRRVTPTNAGDLIPLRGWKVKGTRIQRDFAVRAAPDEQLIACPNRCM